MENVIGQKKGACGHFMSTRDLHDTCRSCRKCSHEQKCSMCKSWTSDDWKVLVDVPKLRSDKKTKCAEASTAGESNAPNQGETSVIQDGPIFKTPQQKGLRNLVIRR